MSRDTTPTDPTTRVLVAPAGPSLNNRQYGKEYYLLQHLAPLDESIEYDAYFMLVEDLPPVSNLAATALNSSRNRYYLRSFNIARKALKEGAADIYHQMDYHYAFYNPLVMAGATSDVPTVIGPAEPPHTVPAPSKRDFIRRVTHIDWSDGVLDRLLPAFDFAKRNVYDRIRLVLFGLTLRRADRVVVVNEETAELYSEHVNRSKIEVIPYGVVPERFEQGDPESSTDLVAIGSQYRRKGFHVLIEAWSRVAAEFSETTLHIIGEGPQKQQFQQLAENLDVRESVHFHGRIDRNSLVDRLANARAFVHPSLSEGFPHVRLEAMVSGCPVIASDITGTREMIRDGIDGRVVPVDSVTELAAAMSELLGDPALAGEMGRHARERARDEFDWHDIAQRFLQIYEDVL